MKYSQARQDEFVLSLIDNGTFVDVGCYLPDKFNNTMLLEEHGWTGIAVDIKDFSEQWEIRKTPFVCGDALSLDWGHLFHDMPDVIDYLSLDIDGIGGRFIALSRILGHRQFKIITVEHDLYKKYHLELEAIPQRNMLQSLGYDLVCKNVRADTRPFEDWWVHPDYVNGYEKYKSEGLHVDEIMKLC